MRLPESLLKTINDRDYSLTETVEKSLENYLEERSRRPVIIRVVLEAYEKIPQPVLKELKKQENELFLQALLTHLTDEEKLLVKKISLEQLQTMGKKYSTFISRLDEKVSCDNCIIFASTKQKVQNFVTKNKIKNYGASLSSEDTVYCLKNEN